LSYRERSGRHQCLVGLLAAASTALFATDCLAQPELHLEFDSSVFLSDNPFLLPGKDRAAAAAEIAVRPGITWPVGPKTTVDLSSSVALRQYHRRYGTFVTGQAEATVRHRENEYLSLTSIANFARDLSTDVLTESVDAAIDTRSIRISYGTRSTVDWTPNATTTITGDIGAQRMRYLNSVLLSATTSYDLGVALSKRISSLTSVGARAQLTVSKAVANGDSSARSFQLTASRRLAEAWRAEAQLGVEWTRVGDPLGNGGHRRARFMGSAALCYEPRRFLICLNASMRSEVSGFSGLQRATYLGASMSGQLTERGSVTATAEYRKARVRELGGSNDVVRIAAAYDHRLNQRFSIKAGVDYLQRTRLDSDKTHALIFQIGVTFKGPRR